MFIQEYDGFTLYHLYPSNLQPPSVASSWNNGLLEGDMPIGSPASFSTKHIPKKTHVLSTDSAGFQGFLLDNSQPNQQSRFRKSPTSNLFLVDYHQNPPFSSGFLKDPSFFFSRLSVAISLLWQFPSCFLDVFPK